MLHALAISINMIIMDAGLVSVQVKVSSCMIYDLQIMQ